MLLPLLRRESLFGKWIDEHRVSREPEFWRLVGLVLGDNDGKRALNTFCNTNDVLVEYFVDVASRLFGESFVELSKKRDKRQSRKELRVARILGTAGRILAEYASRAHDLVDDVDEDCFWQLVTSLYESDGSITVRYPSRDYAVPYPDISIRLAAHQSKLAEAISGRLTREGIAASFKIRSSVAEIRITSTRGYEGFFTRVRPLIKDPRRPETFRGTRTRDKTVEVIRELHERIAGST